MYTEGEIGASENYLRHVIEAIESPVVVLGGWAVRFLVDEGYRELTGRDYLGSRDIDLGFTLEEQSLERTAFARAYRVIVHDLGFRPVSFRLLKEINAETGEPLDEETARNLPTYQIVQIYVDMVVDRIPDEFSKHFGYVPIDEPLLIHVFQNEEKRVKIEKFGRTIWIPTGDVLLAMKVRSCPHRDNTHKKVKDVCDIAAVSMFGLRSRDEGWSIGLVAEEDIEVLRKVLKIEDLEQASEIIGIPTETIQGSLARVGLV